MSVLNRRMFQNGGEVRVIQSGVFETGSYRNPKTETQSIEEQDGVFYSRTRDQNGNLKKEEIIDLSLSANRDPIEALNIQKRNKALSTAADFLTAAPAVVGGIGGLGYLGARELAKRSLGRKLSDIFFTRDPGKVTGKYGTERIFAGQGPISGLTGTGATAVGVGTGATIGAALRSMQQGPVEPIDEVVQKDKKLSGKLFDQPKKEKPEGPKVDPKFKDQPLVSKVISSPDFNRFLSNLSSSLTETGSFAQGAAQAASDSFEEKLTSVEDVVGLETSDAERNRKVNELLSNQLDSFNRTETNIAKIDYVLSILDDDATGFKGLLGQAFDSVNAFFGNDIDKAFEGLSARERADKLLLALRQQDIRAILGESGRTISNLDREIVADIFGDITMFTPAPAIRRKLNDIRDQYADRLADSKNQITSSVGYFKDANMPSDVVQSNFNNILRISNMKNFRNYVPPKYDPDKDRYMISQSQGPITDIEYVEGT